LYVSNFGSLTLLAEVLPEYNRTNGSHDHQCHYGHSASRIAGPTVFAGRPGTIVGDRTWLVDSVVDFVWAAVGEKAFSE
jgi:hypothetical protein